MSNTLGHVHRLEAGKKFKDLALPNLAGVPLVADSVYNRLANHYNGIVALVVRRSSEEGSQILTGIRRAETNQAPKNVVSVPTAMVGVRAVADGLKEDQWQDRPDDYTIVFNGTPYSFERTRQCYTTNLGKLATLVMAVKLNLGERVEDLVTSGASFRYHNLILGGSIVDSDPKTGEDLVEANAMLGIGVDIPAGSDELFEDSMALHSLSWVNEVDFIRGVSERDAGAFFENQADIDEVDVCVHGLCLASAKLSIRGV